MYPRNAASPERLAIGAVVQISDGAVQSSGVTITVRGQGGAEGTGAGTTAYGASGIVYYTPTQGETDFTSFVVIASKTGCIPVSVTVVTSASATPGYAGVDWSKIANATATVNLSNTTVKTLTDAPSDSSGTTTLLSRLSSARAGYLDNLSAGAVALEATLTAMKGATFDGATDSLEALRNRGDSAWMTATGFATSGALTTVEGKIDTIDTVVDAILDDTGTTGVEIAANALDAAALATDAVDEIKAAIAAITVTELASIPAASPSLIQAIALVYMAIRNKRDTDSTGGTDEIHNDAGTVIGTATVSDSGTLFSKGKYA